MPTAISAATATGTQLQVALPTDHPLLGVLSEPVAGWTSKVTEIKLDPPVQTDDGPVSSAVSQITWVANAGAGTPPGQFQEFRILVQRLPAAVDRVAFPAIETTAMAHPWPGSTRSTPTTRTRTTPARSWS